MRSSLFAMPFRFVFACFALTRSPNVSMTPNLLAISVRYKDYNEYVQPESGRNAAINKRTRIICSLIRAAAFVPRRHCCWRRLARSSYIVFEFLRRIVGGFGCAGLRIVSDARRVRVDQLNSLCWHFALNTRSESADKRDCHMRYRFY